MQADLFDKLTQGMGETFFPEGTVLIEIRGVYDGWSIAKLPDGTLVNRWPEDDRRYAPTQAVIEHTQQQGE